MNEEILSNDEYHKILMRKLNNLAIQCPRKISIKILDIIDKLESLRRNPYQIRFNYDEVEDE
jgi:hypothetical protein